MAGLKDGKSPSITIAPGMFGMLLGATSICTMRRSCLAIALPVLAATSVISALAFWVGWTMMNTEPDLAELEEQQSVPTPV